MICKRDSLALHQDARVPGHYLSGAAYGLHDSVSRETDPVERAPYYDMLDARCREELS